MPRKGGEGRVDGKGRRLRSRRKPFHKEVQGIRIDWRADGCGKIPGLHRVQAIAEDRLRIVGTDSRETLGVLEAIGRNIVLDGNPPGRLVVSDEPVSDAFVHGSVRRLRSAAQTYGKATGPFARSRERGELDAAPASRYLPRGRRV